jgi:hypothetical protein
MVTNYKNDKIELQMTIVICNHKLNGYILQDF